jgi:hypothetical protein
MKSFCISDYSQVKRIRGSMLDDYKPIRKLCFSNKDGIELSKVEIENVVIGYGPEVLLADDEEIIGIYGTKEVDIYVS